LVLVNRSKNEREALKAFDALSGITERFLKKQIHLLGSVPEDSEVTRASRSREAFWLASPNGKASEQISAIIPTIEALGNRPSRPFAQRFVQVLQSAA
jgi:flagellar biosynthesis protein FlhG